MLGVWMLGLPAAPMASQRWSSEMTRTMLGRVVGSAACADGTRAVSKMRIANTGWKPVPRDRLLRHIEGSSDGFRVQGILQHRVVDRLLPRGELSLEIGADL